MTCMSDSVTPTELCDSILASWFSIRETLSWFKKKKYSNERITQFVSQEIRSFRDLTFSLAGNSSPGEVSCLHEDAQCELAPLLSPYHCWLGLITWLLCTLESLSTKAFFFLSLSLLFFKWSIPPQDSYVSSYSLLMSAGSLIPSAFMNHDPSCLHAFHSSAQSNGRLHLTFQVKFPALSHSDNNFSDVSGRMDGDWHDQTCWPETENNDRKPLRFALKVGFEKVFLLFLWVGCVQRLFHRLLLPYEMTGQLLCWFA